jgi:hypothetical protein
MMMSDVVVLSVHGVHVGGMGPVGIAMRLLYAFSL